MRAINGNELTFKTFNYLEVNESRIELPEIQINNFKLESDERVAIKEFQNREYGISNEAVKLNEKIGNLYKYYETKPQETKDFGIIRLQTDDQNKSLLDTHDIVASEGSSVKLILDYSDTGEEEKFRNTIVRILAKKDSDVKVHIIQKEGVKSLSCESVLLITEDNANVDLYQYELGAKRLYTNYQADIRGDNSRANVESIYFAYKEHDIDMLYNIFHYGKESISSVVVNGVMKENSQKVFKSNLDFKEGCTKSDGTEEEYVLMLDNSCKNIAVPILLCHEDDVKGNHAASSGKLDLETLFYLMSRGLDREQAEAIIIESKFSPAIDALENKTIEAEIWAYIRAILKDDIYVER